jgi:HSP20 family protein
MKQRINQTQMKYTKRTVGILTAVLILAGGWVWAEKNTEKFQPKTDDSATQNPQTQTAPLPSLNPFRDMIQLQQEMDRLFGSTLNPYSGFPAFDAVFDQDIKQAMDLRERPDAFVVQMDLPGLDKSDIQIEVVNHLLTVSGERKGSIEKKDDEHVLMQERSVSSFRREVVLPSNVDADHVTAEYKAGVLTITLPKTEQDETTRKIEIK